MKKSRFQPVAPMANFPEMEKRILALWYERGIVAKYLHRNDAAKKRFSFFDGPITANNPMGVHHAWGRTYKDLWQRFFNMRGARQRFQNGFDCQGLWVEVEVEKELGIKTKKDIENLIGGDKKASIAKFVELCKERVRKYSRIQTEQSKRLGYFMDWDNSYYTMSDENNYMIWHFLKTCHEKGWIYKGFDSVPWCPRCQTAISQHEILTEDYKDLTHKAIYLALPVAGRVREYLLVWTTTPWTIPANIAVAVDATLDYSLVESATGDRFWVAKDLVAVIFGKSYRMIVKTVKGQELVGLSYYGPFNNLPAVAEVAKKNSKTFHKVVATDPMILQVTTAEGTGLVHTAVSAGTEDFRLGRKLGLPMIPVIADDASYLAGLGLLTGKNAQKHPEIIFDYLKEREKQGENWIFEIRDYTHRYPVCWRCKSELVWKATEEWYIAMDRSEKLKVKSEKLKVKTLRQQMMETAKQITWHPRFGLERELDWLSNMQDWLISKKNRYWGLALPIYECQKCNWFTVVGGKEELKKRAVSGWSEFEGKSPHKPFIDEVKIKCDQCGEKVARIDDVGNVWLDAGIVPFSTLVDLQTRELSYTTDKKYWREWFPAEFITESFPGQFKNWFYSLIAMATVLEKTTSFKTVLGYASVLGEDGRAMHKSLGNAIEFNEGADKIGVDVMRWMFARQDPEQNILFGYTKADETRRKFHLTFWNVYNFFVTYANIDRFAPSSKFKVQSSKLTILDQWILSKLHSLINLVTTSLERYDAAKAASAIETFVTDLSQWYVRRSRDRVGPTADHGEDKDACFSTLYHVLVTLAKLLAPFTPFISEEIYRNLTGEESVHLATWPTAQPQYIHLELEQQMTITKEVVEAVHATRKFHKIKVRQPLPKFSYDRPARLPKELEQLMADETNVKEVEYASSGAKNDTPVVSLDTTITPELKAEGEARELVRRVQQLRKEKGCQLDQKIRLQLPEQFTRLSPQLQAYIKKETLAGELVWGKEISILTL
ncbi:MAG: isoleucine--tRNA ligase [Patescibacteria group bacterium]